jgi:hypothetical protein
MKMLFVAATALTLSGAALAYQTYDTTAQTDVTATTTMTAAIDPNVPLVPPVTWTAEQRALYDAHFATLPAHWTAEQRAAYRQQLALAPINWTAEQRALYREHIAMLPADWTAEQRAMYETQIATWRDPWLGTQTAATTTTGFDMSDDYEQFAGMGGPYEEVYGDGTVSLQPRPATTNYPPCRPGPGDDNCIQLYEPGVRTALASWNRSTGGLAQGAEVGMGGPYEPVSSHTTHGTVTDDIEEEDTTTPDY